MGLYREDVVVAEGVDTEEALEVVVAVVIEDKEEAVVVDLDHQEEASKM